MPSIIFNIDPAQMVLIDRLMMDIKNQMSEQGPLDPKRVALALSDILNGKFDFKPEELKEVFGFVTQITIPPTENTYASNTKENRKKYSKAKALLHDKEYGHEPIVTPEKIVAVYERNCYINFTEFTNILPGTLEEKWLTRNQIILFAQNHPEFIKPSGFTQFLGKISEEEDSFIENMVIITLRREDSMTNGTLYSPHIQPLKKGDALLRSADRLMVFPK